MRLRSRVLVVVCLTTAVLVASQYILSHSVLLRNYRALESAGMVRDVERVSQALDQFVQDLHAKSVDWAEWDDTYRFVRDHDTAYVRANLVQTSLASMQMDLVAYTDPEWRIVEAVQVRRVKGVSPPDPSAVVSALRSARSPAPDITSRTGVSGLVSLPGAPLVVSARPIRTTVGGGPPRGWLIFARYLDAEQVRRLGERTRLDAHFVRVVGGRVPHGYEQVLRALTDEPGIPVWPQDGKQVMGAALVRDLAGRPLMVLEVRGSRSIYQQGLGTARYLVGLIGIVSLLYSVLIVLLLERFVLSRTIALTRQVERIGSDASWVDRVELPGHDELSLLGHEINGMLDKLARTHELEKVQAQLLVHNEQLETMVAERTRQIEHQAFHDPLTDLPNRALFLDRLAQALSRSERSRMGVAVLFLDLDNFKNINDSKGHEAGDTLLMGVANRLRACLRPGDTVARFGGDEFTLVLEDLREPADATRVAERIAGALRGAIGLPQAEMFISGSIGIAYCGGTSETPEAMLRNADTAMYQAKANTKGGYVLFDQSMNDRVVERMEIEHGLRRALEDDELVVYYQPLLHLATGALSGVEALVRWQHPIRGLIVPSQFIPVAEETGLIVPLGYWVLEQACRDMQDWRSRNPDGAELVVSVNLSGRQLQRPDIVDRVREILERTGLKPRLLRLEITESVLAADMQEASAKLSQLRALGIGLAIDDFGTGYSSMSALQSLPVDAIKIDRAFISRLRGDPEGAAVVAAIIALSQSMRLDVTAEGIETMSQLEWLRKLGCRTGQGFYFARPMPGTDFEERIRLGREAHETNQPSNEMEVPQLNVREPAAAADVRAA